eukprot:GSChrysophyteH1.ASY1.ANO1.2038.1 assembled CDS
MSALVEKAKIQIQAAVGVPVLKEYLKNISEPVTGATEIFDDSAKEEEGAKRVDPRDARDRKQGFVKGQQLKQRRADMRPPREDRLCSATQEGRECPFENCIFSHDVMKLLSNKAPDLPGPCASFEAFGYCPNGFNCRFGSNHIKIIAAEDGSPKSAKKYDFKDMSQNKGVTVSAHSNASDLALKQQKDTLSSTEIDNFSSSKPLPEKVRLVDFSNKVYVAPLTTVGNLPFRRILKDFGADITCGEMAMAFNLEGAHTAQLLEQYTRTDFIDLNCGCPIDVVTNRGAGSALMNRPKKIVDIVDAMTGNFSRSMTVKIRTGWNDNDPTAHKIVPMLQHYNCFGNPLSCVFIHGRSRQQRYRSLADWEYVAQCARSQNPELPLLPQMGLTSCAMIGRGALIKPWLPKEIHSGQTFDISASERFDMLKNFVRYGYEHWGTDNQGIENTRRFLLEFLSYLHRYVPAGLLEGGYSQRMIDRPPLYFGRSDTETLLGSADVKDWIKISEMLICPVPPGFTFAEKHKSSAYSGNSSVTVQG